MKGKVDLKFCGVCGDKALGYNFNAVTCESCKAFFRRNALLQKDFKCPFQNQCDITTVTRRFCQKCRLDKCFAIGMCKDLIMSEEDKQMKRMKIEENRARKRASSGGSFKSGFKKIKKEQDVDLQFTNSSCDSQQFDQSSPASCIENGPKFELSEGLVSSTSSSSSSSTFGNKEDFSMIRTMLNVNSNNNNNNVGAIETTNSPINNQDNNNHVEADSSINPNNNDNNNQSDYRGNINNNNNNAPIKNVTQTVNKNISNSDIDEITRDVVQDVQRFNGANNSSETGPIQSILCEAIKLEFEAYTSIPPPSSNSRELNEAERAKLNELIIANKALLPPMDKDINSFIGDDSKLKSCIQVNPQQTLETDPALVNVINFTAAVIRRLIKMAKKINAFKNMCQEDQVALLKGGCTEIMILRSAMNYDPTKQTWKIPHSQENLNLNVDILKLAKGNVYQEHERFIKTFEPSWRSDENIILILCAIVLFTPDRPRVIHQDVIKLEQNSYYYLLRRYLESIYAGCEAKSIFLKLIQKIAELHKLNEELINVYLDVNPSQVEPLLIEIFDIKHR